MTTAVHINFYPEANIPRFIEGAKEYQNIWKDEGEKIIETIQSVTGFNFQADQYSAIILGNKPSGSYPLVLSSAYSFEQKQSTLVHELTHKVLTRNDEMKKSELENHKILNIVLYDIWLKLWGAEFAERAVKGECLWGETYKQAWDFARNLSEDERSAEWKKYLSSIVGS